MPYKLITSVDMSSGIEAIIVYLNDITGGLFMVSIIFMIYMVIGLGSYYAQYRMKGKADAAASFAVAGYLMIPFTALISMIRGAVNGAVIVEVIILAAVGSLWLYFSKTTQIY